MLKDYDFEAASKADSKFNCRDLEFAAHTPKTVHELRPSDIKVVGAIGDSLTAANGAKAGNVIELLNEYRGVSWSIGGDSDINSVVTLPNIIKLYNPNVIGFSLNTGNVNSSTAAFNVGQPGHTSHEIYEQAKLLVSRIRANPNVNFNEDWKLVTLFIGGNDLCNSCSTKYPGYYTAANYIRNVRQTLDYLEVTLPKTLVNLVLSLDVTGVSLFESTGFFCKILTTSFCSCGLDPKYQGDVLTMTKAIQDGLNQLVNSGYFDGRDDFTVVAQPFMTTMKPPKNSNGKYDLSFFAPDCFHLSQKGHQTAALELWNNMFEPVGAKSTNWIQFEKNVRCPTFTSPYIYTSKNSKHAQ